MIRKIIEELLDKRDAKRKEELRSSIIKSEKSYDEILEFITADSAFKKY